MANSQSGATDPWFITKATDGSGLGVSAQDARHAFGALGAASPGSGYGFTSCVIPGSSSGAGTPNDLAVSPSSGMTIAINAGAYQISRGAANGPYTGAFLSAVTVTVPASNASNPRIDYVIVRSRDPGLETTSESARVQVLSGSPSANPVEPAGQMTTGDLLLAAVTVRANTSSILSGDIADRRLFDVARGGTRPTWNNDARAGSYEGQLRDNSAFDQVERWSGTAWEAIAAPSTWRTLTPRLLCTGTSSDISIGTNPTRVGRYQLEGRRFSFNYTWRWGTAPYNGGTGDIYSLLPTHPVTGAQLRGAPYDQWVMAELWVNNSAYIGDFFGQALIPANSTRIQPYFPIRHALPNINMNIKPYRIATSSGVTDGASSIPNIFSPNGYPEGGQLVVTGGSIEVAF